MIPARHFIARMPLLAMTTAILLAAAPPSAMAPVPPAFADLATLGLAAPVVVRATIYKTERMSARDAPTLAAGFARILVSAATSAAIVAPAAIPPRITYLTNIALDARGKPPKLNGSDLLLFLRPGTIPGQYALVSAHAEVAWSAETDATLRAVLTAARGGKVPVVTGVTSAFRVPGAVPGEAESQFFLATVNGKPVSLVVLTRPGQPRRLSIALGDVIDDAAPPIAKNTLLWYRLACSLPPQLPPAIDAGPEVADDYRFILTDLGPCGRTV